MDDDYSLQAEKLNHNDVTYIHAVDHSSMRAQTANPSVKNIIRENLVSTYILSGGYDATKAEHDLLEKNGDLLLVNYLVLIQTFLKSLNETLSFRRLTMLFFTLQAKGVILIIQQTN